MDSGILVKGAGIANTRDYLKEAHAAQAPQILGMLTPPARKTVASAIVAGRYPVEHLAEYLVATRQVLASHGDDVNFKIGLAAAKRSFSLVYKVFFKLGDPTYLIGKAAQVWSQQCNRGRLEVVETGKGFAHVRLADFDYDCEQLCAHRFRANFQAPLELSGCVVTESLHPRCRSHGASACEWRYVWRT